MSDAATPAATSGPPPTADPQDPLPESDWRFRRYFVFGLGILAVAGIAVIFTMLYGLGTATLRLVAELSGARDVRALDQSFEAIGAIISGLVRLGFWLIILQIVNQVLYLIAPSAEQAAKMMATVSAWKGGISTSSTSRSFSADGSSAEASTRAGPAAAPTGPPTPSATDEANLPPYARAA